MPTRSGGLRDKADALYRAAAECHRQHTRYSKLVEKRAPGEEQAAALEMAYMCDDYLATALTSYETAKGHTDGHADDAGGTRATCYGTRAASTSGVMRTAMVEC